MEIAPVPFPLQAPLLSMTLPALAPVLTQPGEAHHFFGVAAHEANEPIGLAIGRTVLDSTVIASIYVKPKFWKRGIGTALLSHLESQARDRGANALRISYSTEHPIHAALEHILTKSGWQPPKLQMRLVRVDQTVMAAPWITRLTLPQNLKVFPWTDLTNADRIQLEQINDSIPPGLRPSGEKESFEPINSLGLRQDGTLIGWLLTHRVNRETIRYTILFIREEWRTSRLNFTLLAEGIRRQVALLGNDSFGSFAVLADNLPMLQIADRKLRPYAVAYHDQRECIKPLGPITD